MSLAWTLFSIYILVTSYLGWMGYKKTKGFDSFAIGAGDLAPWVVGVTMAASTASAATFIINPGFVYVHGLAGFMHFAPGIAIGFIVMLVILSFRFSRIGADNKALTIPHWIGNRYNSKSFALYFAFLNLLSFAFVVLIVGGLSIVMQNLLGIHNVAALIIILTFVTGYIFSGGTYAHVFTNMLQGSLMILVALILIGSGLTLFFNNPSLIDQLRNQDASLTMWVNPNSNLFNNFYSVYPAGFIIGAALVCQPHILTKALYLNTDKQVRQYLTVGIIVLVLFFSLVVVGFYSRVVIPPEQLLDATGTLRQDLVMTMYIKNAFPGWVFQFISVVLLAAGMSTLDGILIGLSTITANDLVLNLVQKFKGHHWDRKRQLQFAHKASHIVLVVVAVMAFLICLNPPKLLGIFGQLGVYGLVVAVVPPLLSGIMYKNVSLPLVWGTSILGLSVHFVLYVFGTSIFPESELVFKNPGVSASLAVLTSTFPALIGGFFINKTFKVNEKE